MPSFGERLKLEREKRAITLEQISTTTKIGTRMLQALEEEDFNRLPGGIFNKGFVRAYARHVGLDEEQTVADYLEASGEAAAPNPASATDAAVDRQETGASDIPRQIPWGGLAAGLFVVALALFLWSHWKQKKDSRSQPTTPVVAPKQMSLAEVVVSKPVPALVGESTRTVTPVPKPASTSSLTTPAAPPASAGEFVVVILAQEESWVSIQVDDGPAHEDTLIAGAQRAVNPRKQVIIKAGNTGGLDFIFNGKKLPSQGDYGEVKTLTFGPSGLQVRPATPPPTP